MKYYEGKEVKILYVDGICIYENVVSIKRDRWCVCVEYVCLYICSV